MAALHPYYPVDVEIPGYLANEWSLTTLLAVFGSACAFVLASAWLVARAAQPDLSRSEVLTVLWFALCKPACSVIVYSADETSISRRVDTSPV
jgi:cholestenol delta-isomerase